MRRARDARAPGFVPFGVALMARRNEIREAVVRPVPVEVIDVETARLGPTPVDPFIAPVASVRPESYSVEQDAPVHGDNVTTGVAYQGVPWCTYNYGPVFTGVDVVLLWQWSAWAWDQVPVAFDPGVVVLAHGPSEYRRIASVDGARPLAPAVPGGEWVAVALPTLVVHGAQAVSRGSTGAVAHGAVADRSRHEPSIPLPERVTTYAVG